MIVKKFCVLSDSIGAAKALCERLLEFCMRNGAYYEFSPLGEARDMPKEATGCVIALIDAVGAARALRENGVRYPIVILTRDCETCVKCYEMDGVYCASDGDDTAVMARLLSKEVKGI